MSGHYHAYIKSDEWKTAREDFLSGSSYCAKCLMPRWISRLYYGQDLHVHHLHYKTVGNESADDLQALCVRCHQIETFGKSRIKPPDTVICLECSGICYDTYRAICYRCDAIADFKNGVSQ